MLEWLQLLQKVGEQRLAGKAVGAWLFFVLVMLVWGLPVQAQSQTAAKPGYWVYPNHSQVRLVTSSAQLSLDAETWVGLHVYFDPHWHGYWQNPGDSGAAPILDVQVDPQQVEVSDILWPVPERIDTPPLTSFGYAGEVLWWRKLRLKAPATAKQLTLKLDAEWLVCKEECIPAFDSFSLPFEVVTGPVKPSAEAALFAHWQQRLPAAEKLRGTYTLDGPTLQLSLANLSEPVSDFFPLSKGLSQQAPQKIEGQQLQLKLEQSAAQLPKQLEGLVRFASGKGVYLQAETRPPPLWRYWLMAFAGGLILNLMPCVFPIIAIKLLGILRQAQDNPALVRLSSLAYTAGVLTTFVGFALLLVTLRAGGQALGWGFQLQSPVFLVGLIWLFFVLALNFLGLFEFRLPLVFQERAGKSPSLWSHFGTGALSVLVASPCSAPFMGVAMGFAIVQPWPVVLSVFVALGLGLALPYLLLCLSPRIVSWLPKPGGWMLLLKEAMFFPMLLTALWLLWVLGQVNGLNAAVAVLASLVVLAVPFWLQVRLNPAQRWRRVLGWLLSLPLALGLAAYGLYLPVPPLSAAGGLSEDGAGSGAERFWQAFSQTRLAEARQAGPVFVDFTAAWCITCQVNEQVTFQNAGVRQYVEQQQITMLKADWTRRDPEITQVLSSFGRISVPFYLFYAPGAAEPKILPEVLTPAIFLEQVALAAPLKENPDHE